MDSPKSPKPIPQYKAQPMDTPKPSLNSNLQQQQFGPAPTVKWMGANRADAFRGINSTPPPVMTPKGTGV